ncbi:hypothetical protein [Azonexus sp.]|uniref:hypothetical protein n=1 Tax=Azonexus sp. TaxID=1872668 RepID=UPI0027BAEC3A|nr:hypothetical protein [Azonexus sp.]
MNLLAAYGLLAHGLIFGALASLLPLGILRAHAALAATTIALLAGIAPVMHASFGTPSVTLLSLAVLRLSKQPRSPLDYQGALGLLAFASLFYPAALGWGAFDPYALGYQPWAILGALVPVGLALWLRRMHLWLLILAADLTAYASGVFANLWDVLLDPLLVFVAFCIVLQHHLLRFIAARRR